MKKIIAFSLLLICCNMLQLSAQTARKVTGSVVDTTKKAIPNVKVLIISDKDTLRTETDEDGHFKFSKVKTESFSVLVSLLGYHELKAQYTFAGKEKHKELDAFVLKMSPQMLEEVVINAAPNPIRFMQDTVEYNAAAFRVEEGDNVADLLKQFPGMEVDENYGTKVMGKEMVKLRVNGQDFFTSDVKDFIGKLPAGIVSKIQVIDDFGDEANFTGIKMGEPTKMLNIVTKPGMNKGAFGNASANSGTNDMIGSQGVFNLWKESKQSSANVNANTANNGAGNSRNVGVGLRHNDRLSKNTTAGLGYNFNNNSSAFFQEQTTESLNEGGNFINDSQNDGTNSGSNHNLNWNINHTNKKFFVQGNVTGGYNYAANNNILINKQSGVFRQDIDSRNLSNSSAPRINGNVSISKKMKDMQNSLSVRTSFSLSGSNRDQSISTNTLYYNPDGSALEKDSLLKRDLYSKSNGKNVNLGFNYSLGLKKPKDTLGRQSLNFSYNANASQNINEVSTFVYDNNSDKVSFVDSLSTSFSTVSFNQSFGMNYNYGNKKIRYNIGLNANPNLLTNHDLRTGQTTRSNMFNYAPNMSFSKTLTKGKTLSFNYNGANINPTINQLQPIRNTQSLQNITVGNPDLKSSFSHHLNANFNYAQFSTGNSIQVGVNASGTQREIVDHVILIPDTLNSLKQITRYENVNGNYQVNGNYAAHIPIMKKKLSLRYSGSLGFSRRAVIFNNQRTFGSGLNFMQDLGGDLSLKKFNLHTSINYSVTNNNNPMSLFRSTDYQTVGIGQVTSSNFFRTTTFGVGTDANLTLKNLRMNGSINYRTNHSDGTRDQSIRDVSDVNMDLSGQFTVKKFFLRSSVSKRINYGYALANSNPLLLNMGVGKSFLKNNTLSVNISGNDILGQGNNISRTVSGNTIVDTRNRQQTRVFSINVNYNLSQFGGRNFRVDAD